MRATGASSELRKYLEFVTGLRANFGLPPGYHYTCFEGLVLREGIRFGSSRFYARAPATIERQCYRNAFLLAQTDPKRLTYFEGYALGGIPVMHAWCVKAGKVLEPTWRTGGRAYMGIALPYKYVETTILATGVYGVINNPSQHFPLLRKPLNLSFEGSAT